MACCSLGILTLSFYISRVTFFTFKQKKVMLAETKCEITRLKFPSRFGNLANPQELPSINRLRHTFLLEAPLKKLSFNKQYRNARKKEHLRTFITILILVISINIITIIVLMDVITCIAWLIGNYNFSLPYIVPASNNKGLPINETSPTNLTTYFTPAPSTLWRQAIPSMLMQSFLAIHGVFCCSLYVAYNKTTETYVKFYINQKIKN